MGSSSMAGMAARGVSGDPYNPYGFAYETQPYPHNDLPPHVQHNFPPREASLGMSQDPYSHERNVRGYMESPAHPQFPNRDAKGSDSGIDMNPPGPLSDWSQSSTTPNAPSMAYAGHGTYGASPTVDVGPGASAVDPASQLMYLNQPRVSDPTHWTRPAPSGHHDQWQSAITPQQGDGMVNVINKRIQVPVRESMGMYQFLPLMKPKNSSHPVAGIMMVLPKQGLMSSL